MDTESPRGLDDLGDKIVRPFWLFLLRGMTLSAPFPREERHLTADMPLSALSRGRSVT
ncbi:MAG: hypothetical protein K0R75_963 [Paenibacillaceae bacterium]|nr:hypothetical protein [Paenibacillaceae bacterium]